MSTTRTHTAVIDRMQRLTNSANGNPAYRVHFTDGSSAKTRTDAGFVYGLSPQRLEGATVTVTYDGTGQIVDIIAETV